MPIAVATCTRTDCSDTYSRRTTRSPHPHKTLALSRAQIFVVEGPELVGAEKSLRRMNATDQAVMAALEKLAIGGVATVSVRRLAEYVGRSRETASKSVGRLVAAGRIVRMSAGRGLQSGRYGVPPRQKEPAQNPDNNRPPGDGDQFKGVRDLFRSSDLYGAGRLFEAAPKDVPLSVARIMDFGVTRSRGGVTAQLTKLESLPVPLATSQPDPAHRQRKLWTFHALTAEAEAVNMDHLDGLGARYRPRYRLDQEMQHLTEQEANRERLGMEPFALVADRDILPNVIEDPVTGCLLYLGQANGSGYGTVHPQYMGIGVHRVVWIAERGSVPAGHDLHHDCGVRCCVNVRHIRALTEAEHRKVHEGDGRSSF